MGRNLSNDFNRNPRGGIGEAEEREGRAGKAGIIEKENPGRKGEIRKIKADFLGQIQGRDKMNNQQKNMILSAVNDTIMIGGWMIYVLVFSCIFFFFQITLNVMLNESGINPAAHIFINCFALFLFFMIADSFSRGYFSSVKGNK